MISQPNSLSREHIIQVCQFQVTISSSAFFRSAILHPLFFFDLQFSVVSSSPLLSLVEWFCFVDPNLLLLLLLLWLLLLLLY